MERSIFILKNEQVADEIEHDWQVKKYLYFLESASCRYIDLQKSICNWFKKSNADISDVKKASTNSDIQVMQIH